MIRIIFILLISLFICSKSQAQIDFANKNVEKKDVIAFGYYDYPPFGKLIDKGGRGRIYETVIGDFVTSVLSNYEYIVNYVNRNSGYKYKYNQLIEKIRRENTIDLILGMFSQTELYEGIDIVYPSIVDNPIAIIALPANAEKIKSVGDLKNFKGAVNSQELMSDYVKKEMSALPLVKADNHNKLFEMLFKGEIDYILTGYYYGSIEASNLGLKNKLVFSKQSIWNMPIFIGVGKNSPYREPLMSILGKASGFKGVKERMNQKIIEAVERADIQNRGVVPPRYAISRE